MTPMGRVLLLLIVVALGLMCWFLFMDPLSSSEPDPAAPPRAQEDRPEHTQTTEPQPERAVVPGRVVEPAPRDTPDTRSTGTLQGLVRLYTTADADEERPAPSGSFSLLLRREGADQPVPVTVESGRWQTGIPADREWEVHELLLDGRKAWPFRTAPTPDDRGQITIHAAWVAPKVLHVLDAGTGAHLREVSLHLATDLRRPPDADATVGRLAQGTSPLELEPFLVDEGEGRDVSLNTRVWVGAPGYAWKRTQVDFRDARELAIPLRPASALEVHVQPPPADWESEAGLQVDLTAQDRQSLPWSVGPLETDVWQWTALEPGAYSVELKDRATDVVLDAESLTLRAGVPHRVDLHAQTPANEPASVPLAGTLELPRAWNVEPAQLLLRCLDRDLRRTLELTEEAASQADTQAPQRYTWAAQPVPPGRYQFQLLEPGWATEWTVGPLGDSQVALQVPAPAEARIHLVDGETGQTVTDLELRWRLRTPEASAHHPALRDDRTRSWTLRAPVGEVELLCNSEQWRLSTRLTLQPGLNTQTVEVFRICGVRITYHWNGTLFHPDLLECPVQLAEVNGTGTRVGWSLSYFGPQTATASRAGRYTLTVAPLPGFRPVPPRQVAIPYGEMVDVVIDLESGG